MKHDTDITTQEFNDIAVNALNNAIGALAGVEVLVSQAECAVIQADRLEACNDAIHALEAEINGALNSLEESGVAAA